MKYFYEPYTNPLNIDSEDFIFKKLSDINNADKEELAKIYCTLFNQDNKIVIEKLRIKGKSCELGIWSEKPHSLYGCRNLLNEYVSNKYFGVCAYGLSNNKKIPVGACVYQPRDLDDLKSNGYKIPFEIPTNIEYWCAIDTFRLELMVNGIIIRGLVNKMRDYLIKQYKNEYPVLQYSSTNNPVMVKSWKKYGFTVVNKETTFGNKYQAFKIS